MEYSELLRKLTKMGLKQGAIEKYCNMINGKTTEILRGRTLITDDLIQQTIGGLESLTEDLQKAISELQNMIGKQNNSYLVYEFTFPNGKKYYGHTYNADARWQNGSGYKTQKVGKAIEEFGWDNVQKRIIAENLPLENAMMIERSLIKGTGSDLDFIGYNVY